MGNAADASSVTIGLPRIDADVGRLTIITANGFKRITGLQMAASQEQALFGRAFYYLAEAFRIIWQRLFGPSSCE